MVDVLSVITVFAVISMANGEVKTASACFGSTTTNCGFLTLDCGKGSRIRLLSEQYGVKQGSCKTGSKCKRNNGCCRYNSSDCFEYYSNLHKYNLYKECSWKTKCGPLPAPNNVLSADCNGDISTYVYVEYECVSENTLLPFCGNTSMSGTEINIVFDGSSEDYEQMTQCDCIVYPFGESELDIHVEDIRMIKQSSGTGSDCSSASIVNSPETIQFPPCINTNSEAENFFTNNVSNFAGIFTGFELSRLYNEGPVDRPTMVWISLNESGGNDMFVTCIRSHGIQTTHTTASPTGYTQPTNGTKDSDKDEEGSSVGIIAGVISAVIILVVIAAVVGFFLFKRRRKGDKRHDTARPNMYTSDAGTATQDEEYAEIGNIGDSPEPPIYDPVYEPPIYDPVYESRKKEDVETSNTEENGYMYAVQSGRPASNSNLPLPTKADRKPSKTPLQVITSQTDRFFAWFRSRQDSSNSKGENRSREASYDHIHGNTPVIVKVTTPEDNENHVYAHQNMKPSVVKPIETTPTGGRISKDMSALQLEDSYIGFTFDEVDKNDPKLLKCPAVSDSRPVPPLRPPPSPNNTPRHSPTSSSPLIADSPKTARPKSPMRLSPLIETDSKGKMTYDYAESNPNSRRGSDASKSDISDHSYKILERDIVYDYADMNNDEQHENENETTNEYGGSLYEDVDGNSRAQSVKKHKSFADVPEYIGGYEVPVSNQDRPVSAPAIQKVEKSNNKGRNLPVIGKLNKELLEKNKLKALKPQAGGRASPKPMAKLDNANVNDDKNTPKKVPVRSNQPVTSESASASKVNANSNVNKNITLVKSDNVEAKDYEKADKLKGVLNMAKLFESKA